MIFAHDKAKMAAMDNEKRKSANRYARQIRAEVVGQAGQEALMDSKLLLVGCGALGSVIAELLVRAGIGDIRIIDRDIPEIHNLQRQFLYKEEDVAERLPKAAAAKNRLAEINSSVLIEAHVSDFNYSNAERFASDRDLIIDGTDNFETRQLINDTSIALQIPWIYGGAIGTDGMVKAVIPGQTSCFRCIMDELPEPGSVATCETTGIIAPTSVMVASLQVVTAFKLLMGEEIDGSMTILDIWENELRTVAVPRLDDCPACQLQELRFLDGEGVGSAEELCGQNTVQVLPPQMGDIDLEKLAEKLQGLGKIKRNKFYLEFDDDSLVLTVFPDARCLVKGTEDTARARAMVSKYLG